MTLKGSSKPRSRTNGLLIDDVVAVDFWNCSAIPSTVKFFFLTHCHSDHTDGLSPGWNRGTIITSETNQKLLIALKGVCPSRIRSLPLGEARCLARDSLGRESLSVTLLDANHIQGAVMLLLKGALGTILVTGDFRFSEGLMSQDALAEVVKMRSVDRLYLDNTFLYKDCDFPPRQVVLDRVVEFLEEHPRHVICIGTKTLGKEEAFVEIARALNEKICVSREKMIVLKLLNLPDVFTTNALESRVFLVNQNVLRRSYLEDKNKREATKGIILSALYHNWKGGPYSRSTEFNLHVFEYSDHCSYHELMEFVRRIRPSQVIPIVNDDGTSGFLRERDCFITARQDMSLFQPLLSGREQTVVDSSLLKEPIIICGSSPSKMRRRRKRTKCLSEAWHKKKGVEYLPSSDSSLVPSQVFHKDTSQVRETPLKDADKAIQDILIHDLNEENLDEILSLAESCLTQLQYILKRKN